MGSMCYETKRELAYLRFESAYLKLMVALNQPVFPRFDPTRPLRPQKKSKTPSPALVSFKPLPLHAA
jgi:hypothetical protein